MSGEQGERRRKVIWGSAQGEILPGSLRRDETGVSATVRDPGGAELLIRAEGDRLVRLVEEAAERGGPEIFQGHQIGDPLTGGAELLVRIVGPLELVGAGGEIIRSPEGGRPHVAFWMLRETRSSEGVTYPIGTGVNVYDEEADALSGLREGDRVRLQARHGPDGFIATSPVTVLRPPPPDGPDAG